MATFPEAQTARAPADDHLDGVVAALAQERHAAASAGQIWPKGHSARGMVHAHPVRAEEAHAAGYRAARDLRFEGGGVAATGLAQAAREEVQEGHARSAALGDDRGHALRGNAADEEVDVAVDFVEGGVGPIAPDLVCSRVDGEDRAFEAELAQGEDIVVAGRVDVGRGTDDGDRARREQTIEARCGCHRRGDCRSRSAATAYAAAAGPATLSP